MDILYEVSISITGVPSSLYQCQCIDSSSITVAFHRMTQSATKYIIYFCAPFTTYDQTCSEVSPLLYLPGPDEAIN